MECTLRCGIIHEGYLAWRQHNEPPMKAQLRLNRDAINSFIQSFFLHFTVHTFGLISKKHIVINMIWKHSDSVKREALCSLVNFLINKGVRGCY